MPLGTCGGHNDVTLHLTVILQLMTSMRTVVGTLEWLATGSVRLCQRKI
jgi:hypothetical protein